ncbi:MAG: EAL domain-containing protein [Polaromonas sp.]|nr:EAL domain-containing protein [Polaromonas sp.]
MKTEALQRAIFNSVNFASIATDAASLIQIFNVGAERLLGYAAADVVGKMFPGDMADSQALMDRAKYLSEEFGTPIAPGFESLVYKASRGIEDIYEMIYVRKDGVRLPVVLSVTALRDDLGEGIGYLLIGSDNTARKKLEDEREKVAQRLRDLQLYTRALFDSSVDALTVVSAAGTITDVNTQMQVLTACPRDELIGSPFSLYFTEPERADAAIAQVLKDKKISNYQLIACAKDGTETVVSCNAAIFYDEHDNLQGIFAAVRDISERIKAEESIQAASVFNIAREGIMITAADGAIINVNDAFTHITGYSRGEVLGQNPRLLNAGVQAQGFYAAMFQSLADGGHWSGEVWDRHKNGSLIALMETIVAVRDSRGTVKQYVSLFSDITALKAHQDQLEHLAQFDGLTNLPNRVLLADRLLQGMAQVKRHSQQLLAVVFIDLDAFKAVNDNHGHQVGDQLLIALAERMQKSLRVGDTLARIGGDEFVAVLVDLPDVEASVPMLTRLLAAVSQPVPLGDLTLQLTASLGITFYPQADDVDAEQLIRQADQAMYLAKQSGKNRYHIFDAVQDRSVREHYEHLKQLRRALSQNEFVLHYQPKVNMRTGELIGAEALIRWQHPERGLLLPMAFLPAIEDHPLAIEIGEWVIHAALTQLSLWRGMGLAIPVSVNIGARQLKQLSFVARVREILAAYPHIRPGDLQMEVLETCAFENLSRVSDVIEACRQLGVQFALDDFGTGYSSLTYLKRLPVTLLKIDQSFVANMLDDADDLAILTSVVGLAGAFRRQVIAEGMESLAHGEMLLQLGCDLAQGNGIAPAMPAADVPDWSATWRPDAAWAGLETVRSQDLPLLFARAEHFARVAAVGEVLQGDLKDMPPLNHQPCHFGAWLKAQDMASPEVQKVLQAIDPLHWQLHALEQALLDSHAQGQSQAALARLDELHGLRDALFAQLKSLAQVRSSASFC